MTSCTQELLFTACPCALALPIRNQGAGAVPMVCRIAVQAAFFFAICWVRSYNLTKACGWKKDGLLEVGQFVWLAYHWY